VEPTPELIKRIPARLAYGVTDLSIDFPHGGTALGDVVLIEFDFGFTAEYITAQEFAGQRVEALYTGPGAVLGCAVRDGDKDMLAQIFPGAATGAAGGQVITAGAASATMRPGQLLASRAQVVYVSPKAIDTDPGLLLYRAMPLVAETARLRFAWNQQHSVPMLWQSLPDTTSAKRTWAYGVRGDLSLS